MRFCLLIAILFGSTVMSLAQQAPSPTPASTLSEDQKKKILQVCQQKADLLPKLSPRDRPKYIADCMDKAKPAD